MQWYRAGTITVTNGSATVTGASTLWSDVGTLNPGDILNAPDGKLYEILTINSNTGITLNSVYLGSSLSGQAYSIMPIGLLPSTLAQSVKTTLATANTALASTVRYDINSMGLSLTQQQNARTNIAALSALDVGQGRLSKSVAGGVDVTLSAAEASNQFIELTGTITANINVIVPASARQFFIYNGTTGAFTVTIKTPSGTGVAVANSGRVIVECDGTNVLNPLANIAGGLTLAADLQINAGANYIYSSGGTASSVNAGFYLDGAGKTVRVYTNGAEVARFDTVNFGIAETPRAWYTSRRAVDVFGGAAFVGVNAGWAEMYGNTYLDASAAVRYKVGATAGGMYQCGSNGGHVWYIYTGNLGAGNLPATTTQALTLDNTGNFMIGFTGAGASNSNTFAFTPGQQYTNHVSGSTSGFGYAIFSYAGSGIGSITQSGTTAVLYNTTSDYRLKTDVSTIPGTEALARLAAVRPVDFTWVSDGSKDAGFIAHEFQATYSRNVTGEKDGTEQQEYEVVPAVPATETTEAVPAVMGTRTVPKYQQMDNSAAVPDLVAAVTYLAQQHATIAADFAAYKTAHP